MEMPSLNYSPSAARSSPFPSVESETVAAGRDPDSARTTIDSMEGRENALTLRENVYLHLNASKASHLN
jgi:hypothetical protein